MVNADEKKAPAIEPVPQRREFTLHANALCLDERSTAAIQ
jgi:hypothetical protein